MKYYHHSYFALNKKEDDFDLDEEDLKKRAKKLAGENIKILYGVVKVIGLTTATIVLFNLLVENKPFDSSVFDTSSLWHIIKSGWMSFIHYWYWTDNVEHFKNCINHMIFIIKLILWFTSCFVVILTYEAAMFATIYLAKISSEIDILVIFSFVGFEFFLFAILAPSFFIEKSIPHGSEINSIFWWFIINGCYTLAVCIFCTPGLNMIMSTKIKSKLGEELKNSMKNHLADDIGETFISGISNILFSFIPIIVSLIISKTLLIADTENKQYYIEFIKYLIYLAASIGSLILIVDGYRHQHVKRQETYTLLSLPPTKNKVFKTIRIGLTIFNENKKIRKEIKRNNILTKKPLKQ